ncbi:Tetratricopeptide repeat-containing protein [Chryseolinea serpens]|uniref:Tetratricopeptide repeat-containing protein n=1 Tax=Chryseolinea serpens TaxID=947013 RepID=A0A1M5P1X1_9BACT|nr:tetratricopeptide repeat protein [Chryseolinea serpens]SHG95834.1 Tetratricopeptide repeat-containing protein [Chryseolinea serpens]
MYTDESDMTLVERYFDADLDDADMQEVTRRVETDDSFRALFEREQLLILVIRYQGQHDKLRYLKKMERHLSQDIHRAPTLSLRYWPYLVAAAVVGVLVALFVWLAVPKDSDKLFQAYFKPYPNMFEPGVRSVRETTQRRQALRAYELGDYETAARGLKQAYHDHPEPGLLLLLGNANLSLGHVPEAEENFNALIKNYDDLDLQAKWYLSLCYLKQGDVERAKIMLKELGATEISYASKAKELFEKVN